MKHFVLSTAAAVALAATTFGAEASTVNGVLDGVGAQLGGTVSAGSTLQIFDLTTYQDLGEYAGYFLTDIDDLTFSAGSVNNGQTLEASNGTLNITFTITNTVLASTFAQGTGVPDGWNLSGYVSVSGDDTGLAPTASFSLSGTSVSSPGMSFYIQTPPANFTPPSEVPLPAGAPLLIGALGGLAFLRRKKKDA